MKDNIIDQYLPLVKFMAGKYRISGISFEDMVQEGLIGLLEASERFDPGKGAALSTYAVYYIRKNMLEYISKEKRCSLGVLGLDENIETAQSPGQEEGFKKTEDIKLPDDLGKTEKMIVTSLFRDGKPLALIGKELGIPRERTRQLKERALRKMRVNRDLTEFLYSLNG